MTIAQAIFGAMATSDCIVVHGDCESVVQALPEASIGLTITDPPYESLEKHRAIGTTTRLKESKASSNEWYSTFPNEKYGRLFHHLHLAQVKNSHCYVFCDSETEHVLLSGMVPYGRAGRPLAPESLVADGVLRHRYITPLDVGWNAWPTLTWVKTRRTLSKEDRGTLSVLVKLLTKTAKQIAEIGAPLHIKIAELAEFLLRKGMGYHWSATTERIVFLEKGKRNLNVKKWPNVLFGPRAAKGEHPSAKPAEVVRRMILNSSDEGEWIFDPFAGSGVVGLEAVACGRKAILVDVEPKYIKQIEWPEGKKIIWLTATNS